MKDYFIRLFKYDQYTNQQLLAVIRQTDNPENTIRLMGHLLAAQQRWVSRCLKEDVAQNDLFPQKETMPFEEIIANNSQKWLSFLEEIDADDLNSVITYKNTQGAEYSNTVADILTQVINHGTHHRAQIGQQLKLAGAPSLPVTDYISFIRN
jgi:uncharacterized damage-inducible protein DinB